MIEKKDLTKGFLQWDLSSWIFVKVLNNAYKYSQEDWIQTQVMLTSSSFFMEKFRVMLKVLKILSNAYKYSHKKN